MALEEAIVSLGDSDGQKVVHDHLSVNGGTLGQGLIHAEFWYIFSARNKGRPQGEE